MACTSADLLDFGMMLDRSLHLRLVSMHTMTIVSQIAGSAKYILPVSDTSCLVTHRIMVSGAVLCDVSLPEISW